MKVLFCGINPGQRSGELGQHFARPGNRFWKVLQLSGFTPSLLAPAEQESLLDLGIGITNLAARTSRAASDLTAEELREGAGLFTEKVARYRPEWVAILAVSAYRVAFSEPKAAVGRQATTIAGAGVWLLPNPSGLQAHYQLPEMVKLYSELHAAASW